MNKEKCFRCGKEISLVDAAYHEGMCDWCHYITDVGLTEEDLKEDEFVKCSNCKCYTEYYREEDEQMLCPSCYAELVGISVSEVWRCIG